MIPEGSFKQLPGGLYAAVIRYDNSIPFYRVAFGDALRDIISHEAMVHNAPFDERGFKKVMQALDSGDIQARFFLAAWDLCKPLVVGGTIHVPSVAMKWDGRNLLVGEAESTGDVALFPDAMRELIKSKPHGKSRPNGLAAFFDSESIRQMAEEGKIERYGEIVAKNTRIKKVLAESGTELFLGPESGVFTLTDYTSAMINRWLPTVDPNRIAFSVDSDELCNRRLITSWFDYNASQGLAMSFTKSISSFNGGKPIVEARFLDLDYLPPVASLKDIVTSSVFVGHGMASALLWGMELPKPQSAPSIPLYGSNWEKLSALMYAGREELVSPKPNRSFVFGGLPPETHFFVQDQPKIMAALTELDMSRRKLGPDEAKPGVKKIDEARASRPLYLRREFVERPDFSVAA